MSANGQTLLTFQANGNLVLRSLDKVLWHSSTHGQGATTCTFQTNGNLVLRNGSGGVVWHASTHGEGGSRLYVTDYGNLKMDGAGGLVWHTNTRATTLRVGATLGVGQMLVSKSLSHKLLMQSNGNLVLRKGNTVVTHTQTHGTSATRLVHQANGNLVLRTDANDVVWHSHTHGNTSDRLVVTAAGNVVLYGPETNKLWKLGEDTPASPTLPLGMALDMTYLAFSGYAGQSTWGFPVDGNGHNCTNYIAFRLDQRGVPLHYQGQRIFSGNAVEWNDNIVASGMVGAGAATFSSTPRAGDIAHWESAGFVATSCGGDCGHVAYVEAVESHNVVVSESNYLGEGGVRRVSKTSPTRYIRIG